MTDVRLALRGLGGSGNVLDIEGCVTRVRVEVRDPDLVDDVLLRDHGAIAVVRAGNVVQVVVGPHADALALDLQAAVREESAAGTGLPL